MMNDKIYQDIYNLLSSVLPNKWDKLVFYIEYVDNSYQMKFFTKAGKSKYVDCFQTVKNTKQLFLVFNSIHQVVFPERDKLPKKYKWTVLTYVLTHDGTFSTYFDYSDHHKNMIGWENDWMKKYLK